MSCKSLKLILAGLMASGANAYSESPVKTLESYVKSHAQNVYELPMKSSLGKQYELDIGGKRIALTDESMVIIDGDTAMCDNGKDGRVDSYIHFPEKLDRSEEEFIAMTACDSKDILDIGIKNQDPDANSSAFNHRIVYLVDRKESGADTWRYDFALEQRKKLDKNAYRTFQKNYINTLNHLSKLVK